MKSKQQRQAENEVIFRQRNHAMKNMAREVLVNDNEVDVSLEFICECSDEECRDTVRLPISEYEKARKNSAQFIIVPGHDRPDIERVIKREGYAVVEKYEQPPKSATNLNRT